MATIKEQTNGAGDEHLGDNLSYLHRRIRQEAEAAIRASSIASTSIHVVLATAYAKRFGEDSAASAPSDAQDWVNEHRLW